MAIYVAISKVDASALTLVAYEHPCAELEPAKAVAREIAAVHRSQDSRRMCYNSGKGTFIMCCSEDTMMVCSAFPSSVSRDSAAAFQERIVSEFVKFLQAELGDDWESRLAGVTRAFQFVQFDRVIRGLRRDFVDSESHTAARRVHRQLDEIHSYMSKNVSDLLDRGAALDSLSASSSRLADESKTMKWKAKEARLWAQWSQAAPLVIAALVILFLIYYFLFR